MRQSTLNNWVFFGVVAAVLGTAPGHANAGPRVIEGQPLADPAPTGEAGLQGRILFTSNQLGEFEACECPDTPLGGLAQMAALVTAARNEPLPTFWLDSGDRYFRFDMVMSPVQEAQRRLRALLLVDSAAKTGLDAQGIGRFDLAGGLSYLVQLSKRAGYPFISSNLVTPAGDLVFDPKVLLEADGRSVGVTSVLPGGLSGEGWQTTKPIAAAKAQVKALRAAGAELVVVLSNLGMGEAATLARKTGADLVLSSGSREVTYDGLRAGRAQAGEAGARGRYLGDSRWYESGPKRSPHLVVTSLPVHTSGAEHPAVQRQVQTTRNRMNDPSLGISPVSIDDFNDIRFRGRHDR